MARIWTACRERAPIGVLAGILCRVVESQEQVATGALVDTPAEQELLERLLESSKPPCPSGSERLHYLLATPFRYPPLRHGSRFGARHLPSLFYGSARAPTALAETAYYRLVFLSGMGEPPPSGRLVTQHTLFRARYRTARGLRLQSPPFVEFESRLRNPRCYRDTQALGAAMRAEGVEAFQYRSARDPEGGLNVALFSPAALADTRPYSREALSCDTRADGVTFYGPAPNPVRFNREVFLVDGELPQPAV